MESFDELNLASEKSILKQLDKNEKILFSSLVYKFNEVNKKQERTLMITTQNIFNLSKVSVKRKISMKKVYGITISVLGAEFVVHVPEEYDYRFQSKTKKEQAVQILLRAYECVKTDGKLPVFKKDDLELTKYTTTKIDKKKNQSRLPTKGEELMNEQIFLQRVNEQREAQDNTKKRTKTFFAKKKGEEVTLDSFYFIKVLGRGAYGKVTLVQKKDTEEYYAMKSIRKEDITDPEVLEHTKTERQVLASANHPYLVHLVYAFQTPEKIFFVTQFMKGGELFQHLRSAKRFDEKRAKFYSAQICLALKHLHNQNIIYRDLKPENVLMDEEGNVCLTDFGMAKHMKQSELALSFCGTPEYLSPEMITEVGHSLPADWWALGVFTYEMMFTVPPFYNNNQEKMFQNIKSKDVPFPNNIPISKEGKEFLLALLEKDPKKRLGKNGPDEVINHPWFKEIDFELLVQKKLPTPFKPQIQGDSWIENFDKEFTQEQPINSFAPNSDLINQEEFKSFDFN